MRNYRAETRLSTMDSFLQRWRHYVYRAKTLRACRQEVRVAANETYNLTVPPWLRRNRSIGASACQPGFDSGASVLRARSCTARVLRKVLYPVPLVLVCASPMRRSDCAHGAALHGYGFADLATLGTAHKAYAHYE